MPLPLTTALIAAAAVLVVDRTYIVVSMVLLAAALVNEVIRALLAVPQPRPTTPVKERERTPFVAPEDDDE